MTSVEFKVNGQKCVVDASLPRDTSLNAYLRYVLDLHGTKSMCHQGGCGSCIVMAKAKNPTTDKYETFNVNSCLILVFALDGWEITTIEGVGNKKDGYSDVQKRMAEFNATQCGYCTPGWVMSITSLKDKNLTMAELEKSFGSNTCRCTGFRPILDVVKSFGTDASPKLCQKVKNMKVSNICNQENVCCKRKCSLDNDDDWCVVKDDAKQIQMVKESQKLSIDFGNGEYYFVVFEEDDIFDLLNKYGVESYMLVDGDTSKGVSGTLDHPKLMININGVKSLKTYSLDQNLVLGANICLEQCITIFNDTAKTNSGFAYLTEFAKHFEHIGHVPVRQLSSLAGNLMIKHGSHLYQSDVFLLFESVGAIITIRDGNGKVSEYTFTEFLEIDMTGLLITSILLPPLSSSHIFKSYKIMPRNQNALALVNGAFCVKLNDNNECEDINISIGNISSTFVRASKTEKYLKGKNVFTNEVLQEAIKTLQSELIPEASPPAPSPECRKQLAIGLFYKFILSIAPANQVRSEYRSGGNMLERPVSKSLQEYQTDEKLYPLNQALPKYEAYIQSAGEARYTNDIPQNKHDVFGAFVLSRTSSGEIDQIDASEALKVDGVITLFTAKDIPGKNSFILPGVPLMVEEEEILADSKIKYYGQPVAILVAKSEFLAKKMAKKVTVTYKNTSTAAPVITIDQAKRDDSRYTPSALNIVPTAPRGEDVKHVLTGVVECPSQYHYYMEPLTCVAIPVDQGLEIYCPTQWIDVTQIAIAQSLNMKESDVTVIVRRAGGAFGGKVTRNSHVAAACALVAKKLNVPCRIILPLDSNMTAFGRRNTSQFTYEVGVDDNGKIQYLDATFITEAGNNLNETSIQYFVPALPNCYDPSRMSVKIGTVRTDMNTSTFTRAPGTLEAITSIEQMMEHIAFKLQKDSLEVRLQNMRQENNDIPAMIDELKQKADYENRLEEVKQFNSINRWMKRSIQISVTNFPVAYAMNYTATVSIYRGDGTVTVVTGGIEMGQGLNTKVAQVAAYKLGVPIEKITILPSTSYTSPNNFASGGSLASECACYATMKACDIINERLAPLKAEARDANWETLVFNASNKEVELAASYMMTDFEENLAAYIAYVVTVVETQVDVLTGRFEIIRVDILEDVGVSANPTTDIGQIEGAYVQAAGYYTSEKLVYDESTGALLTNGSLRYTVPLCMDIPNEFNVYLRFNTKNEFGVLGSKAVGEVATAAAHGVINALRKCINDSRAESGYDTTKWIDISMPYNTESIVKALEVKIEEMTLS